MSDWIDALKQRLNEPLPGIRVQSEMSPLSYDDPRFNKMDLDRARWGGVLIVIDNGRFPLIRRPDYGGVHSGQMALPGGRYEQTDRDIQHTALREAEEEIGVNPDHVHILGNLSQLYVPPSNFLVTPVVAFTRSKIDYRLEPKEVAAVFNVEITELLDRDRIKSRPMHLPNNITVETPYFELADQVVWGATAMILNEFKAIISELK